jgi:hypothetical protein
LSGFEQSLAEHTTRIHSKILVVWWKNRDPKGEKALDAFPLPETVRTVYTQGHRDLNRISPDNWNMDLFFLARPGTHQVQLDFFYDYRTNVALEDCLEEIADKMVAFHGRLPPGK